jgi:hypothetical protein
MSVKGADTSRSASCWSQADEGTSWVIPVEGIIPFDPQLRAVKPIYAILIFHNYRDAAALLLW